MFRRMLFLTNLASILVVTALLIARGTGQAFAQGQIPPEDSSCINCHEEQYYLHDTGNWYCLNETKVGCTECHRGHPDMVVKECAHAGLVANPLANDGAICQNCHPDDYQARVQTYASITGFSPTPRPFPTSTIPASVAQPEESTDRMRTLGALPAGDWQATGLGFLAGAFLLSFLFACRCWKIDHGA